MGESLDRILNQPPDAGLPNSWTVKTLGGIATLQRGKDLPVSKRQNGAHPVIGSNGLVGFHSEFVARGPGVLVGRSGSVGKVTWVEKDYWPLNTALWVKDFHGNDREFVFYLLSSLDLSFATSGVSVPTLNRNVVHPLRVVVPPLPEQRAIAHMLRTVQRAKEATENVIAATRQLKQSLMRHLFTYGPVPVDHADQIEVKVSELEGANFPARWPESSVSELVRSGAMHEALSPISYTGAPIPKAWRLVQLTDFAEIRYGLGQPPKQDSNGVPMIRATNVKRGAISRKGLIRIKRDAIPERRNPFLKTGDIIVVRSGAYTGDVAMISPEWDGSVAGYDLIVSPSALLDSEFCAYNLLAHKVQAYFKSQRDRSAQPHLNRQQLGAAEIFLPPLAEQRAIAHVLRTVDRKMGVEHNRRRSLEELFKSLLHNLMTGKLRVPELVEVLPQEVA